MKQFDKIGVRVIGLSYDSAAVLKNFAERAGIQFPLLSDPDSKVIRQLGILNEEVPKESPFFGIPYPGVYIVGPDRKLEAKYFEEDFRQRYTAAGILVQRYGILPESRTATVEGKQLDAKLSASNFIVRPGERIALVLDLQMKPGIHVYAPGVNGYIPIEWQMPDTPVVHAFDTVFPKPEILFLQAINEKVPAYREHIRLTRDVILGTDAKVKEATGSGGRFTIEGTLRYQACDDRMCYIPQTMPLKWTLQYEAFDRQRVPENLQRKNR
ncbi:MAG: redoxin domain-containing protein [Acidobacteriaceae bacterium]|nr:redoxin domain-containing protein [Acidobacteriaceae bacterium]